MFRRMAIAAALAAKRSLREVDVALDDILGDERKMKQLEPCMMNEGLENCDEVGKKIKSIFIATLQNNCAICNDKQKVDSVKGMGFLIKNKPDAWKELSSKYDPQGNLAKWHPEVF